MFVVEIDLSSGSKFKKVLNYIHRLDKVYTRTQSLSVKELMCNFS